MKDPFRPHIEAVCKDEITYEEFEKRCKATWVEVNGPVPEGRQLIVAIDIGRLVVGHIKADDTTWNLVKLNGVNEQ